MALQDNKIAVFEKRVSDLPNRPSPSYSAAEIKAYFDSSPEELREALNAVIDVLVSRTAGSSGAEGIGSAPIAGLSGQSVYEQLLGLEAQIQALVGGVFPPGSITNAMMQDNTITQIKLDVNTKTAIIAGLVSAHKQFGGF